MPPVVPTFQLFYDNDFIAKIPMNFSPLTVGRQEGCQLRLMDFSVSREHCRFTLSDKGEILVEDLSSTNGTLVNGQRIVQHVLAMGDTVSVGRCTLVLETLSQDVFSDHSFFFWKRSNRQPFSKPRGPYVLLKDDMLTEFDSVSFSMAQDQAKADDQAKALPTFLRRIPRLKVVARSTGVKEEVTRFSVSKSIFKKSEDRTLRLTEDPLLIFSQPEVRGRRIKLPWKIVERIVVPVVVVVLIVLVGRSLLTFHIDDELARANKHWDSKLTHVAEELRFSTDTAFEGAQTTSEVARGGRTRALSIDEVWKKIQRSTSLRDYLIFEVLDEFLASEQKAVSLDQVISQIAKLDSVTRRLPTVKKLRVVLASETVPFDLTGLKESRIFFLTSDQAAETPEAAYSSYKNDLTARLSSVSSCSEERRSVQAGKVVVAFTVEKSGRAKAVFINKARTGQDEALWSCFRKKLNAMKFDTPPGGEISILYTFNFAGPSKIEF